MTTIAQLNAMNQSLRHLPCTVPGCTRKRGGVSPICTTHSNRKLKYGHHNGRPIGSHEYLQEIQEVTQFFNERVNHPAIQAACTFLQQWMDEAYEGEAKVGNTIFGRLKGKQIAPLDVLTEIVALWLYSRRNPYQLPDDIRLTHAISWNLCRKAHFATRISPNGVKATVQPRSVELRTTGERIRQTLAGFMVNLLDALEASKPRDELAGLKVPFIHHHNQESQS